MICGIGYRVSSFMCCNTQFIVQKMDYKKKCAFFSLGLTQREDGKSRSGGRTSSKSRYRTKIKICDTTTTSRCRSDGRNFTLNGRMTRET